MLTERRFLQSKNKTWRGCHDKVKRENTHRRVVLMTDCAILTSLWPCDCTSAHSVDGLHIKFHLHLPLAQFLFCRQWPCYFLSLCCKLQLACTHTPKYSTRQPICLSYKGQWPLSSLCPNCPLLPFCNWLLKCKQIILKLQSGLPLPVHLEINLSKTFRVNESLNVFMHQYAKKQVSKWRCGYFYTDIFKVQSPL